MKPVGDRHRLYGDLAWLWPYVSPPEEYAEAARLWIQELRSRLGPGRHRLLDLGAGGGHHLSHLRHHFKVVATDISEAMLAHSRRLNPDVEHLIGDMRQLRLGETFGAVTIHDAVGYLTSREELVQTFTTAAAHLEPGGVVIAAPDLYAETFTDGMVDHERHVVEGIDVTLIEYLFDPDPADTTYEAHMVFFVREGSHLRVEQDRHLLGLFSLDTWLACLEEAGFRAEAVEHPVHVGGLQAYLLVGVKRGARP